MRDSLQDWWTALKANSVASAIDGQDGIVSVQMIAGDQVFYVDGEQWTQLNAFIEGQKLGL